MMKKLQNITRERMNSTKILDVKSLQGLKRFERIEKGFERIFLNLLTVREKAFKEMICSLQLFFYFLRLNASVVGLFFGFLTSGFD